MQIEENGGPDPLYTTGEAELDDNMFFSPRIWAGVQYCGWGVLGRVWWLDGADSVFVPETVNLPAARIDPSVSRAKS